MGFQLRCIGTVQPEGMTVGQLRNYLRTNGEDATGRNRAELERRVISVPPDTVEFAVKNMRYIGWLDYRTLCTKSVGSIWGYRETDDPLIMIFMPPVTDTYDLKDYPGLRSMVSQPDGNFKMSADMVKLLDTDLQKVTDGMKEKSGFWFDFHTEFAGVISRAARNGWSLEGG